MDTTNNREINKEVIPHVIFTIKYDSEASLAKNCLLCENKFHA
jgi:hypothetical protein